MKSIILMHGCNNSLFSNSFILYSLFLRFDFLQLVYFRYHKLATLRFLEYFFPV